MRVERLTRLNAALFVEADLADHTRLTNDMVPEAVRMADAAAWELELYSGLALLNQSIRVTLDAWPDADWFPLPIAPHVSGATLTITVAGAAVTAFTIIYGLRPSLRLTDTPPEGDVVITYIAGFGTTAAAIPPDLRHAILDQAAVFYDLRGQADAKGNGMSPHMARIAARYRRVGV